MNSIKFIGQAIDYEARRQIELIEDSQKILIKRQDYLILKKVKQDQ